MAPTLMLNGRDDFIFPLDSVAKPLFSLLGAPADANGSRSMMGATSRRSMN